MSLSPAAPVKEIDWEGRWMSYRDLFDKPSTVRYQPRSDQIRSCRDLDQSEQIHPRYFCYLQI